jgi:hypothetical protein
MQNKHPELIIMKNNKKKLLESYSMKNPHFARLFSRERERVTAAFRRSPNKAEFRRHCGLSATKKRSGLAVASS